MPQEVAKSPAEQRKIPRQQRALATCAAIVEAAARILEAQGEAALNTNRVAEVAGVSIGTLYQYYPDKTAILVALVRREREMFLGRLQSIPADGVDAFDAMIAEAISHQFARPRLALAIERLEPMLALDSEAAEMAQQIADLSAQRLAARFGALAPSDLVTGVIIARSLINAAAEGVLPTERLTDRVGQAVAGYLERVGNRSDAAGHSALSARQS